MLHLAINKNLRVSMFILFISNLYPNYYTWWVYWNAWNDDFYSQWNHQLFFSITEFLSTIVILYMSDTSRNMNVHLLIIVLSVAVVHAVGNSKDQLHLHVFGTSGAWHQILRGVTLFFTDTIHICVSGILIYNLRNKYSVREIMYFPLLVTFLGFIYMCL